LPGKNTADFLGSPLVSWTIKAAKASSLIDEVVVSTDSRKIAEISQEFGAVIPGLRSPALSGDASLVSDAAIDYLTKASAEGDSFENIILLEPTSPLRAISDLDSIIQLLQASPDADAVVSFTTVRQNPAYVHSHEPDGLAKPFSRQDLVKPRQALTPLIYPNGVGYIVRVKALLEERTFYPQKTKPFIVAPSQGYEIDYPIDLLIVSSLARQEEFKWLS
jgi:N-acylneuraminate cytidylyltransferase/CMP-N,N'-diacetyllegionaminic acid synthase